MGVNGLEIAAAVFDKAGEPLACSMAFRALLAEPAAWRDALRRCLPAEALSAEAGWSGLVSLAGGRTLFLSCESCGDAVVAVAAADANARAGGTASARLAECMVHDARNPLNALAIQIELVTARIRAHSPSLSESLSRNLTSMKEQVQRVDGVLRRFLRFASPPPDPAGKVDLAEVVRQAVEVCGHDARRHGVTVGMNLEGAEVEGDTASLAQAVLQLVMQGIETRSGGGRLSIGLGRKGAEAVLTLEEGVSGGTLPAAGRIAELGKGRLSVSSAGGRNRLEVHVPLAKGGARAG